MPSEPQNPEGGDFGKIAELHRAFLQQHALHLSRDPQVAQELVQDTLERGLTRFNQLRHGSYARAWLVTILTNLFYDYLKHQKVVRKAEKDLIAPEAQEVECTSVLDRISDADLYAAVQALEPELRDVVELCYIKQMRYRDAAKLLNLPAGTIGSRLMRARARLRELLTPVSLSVVKS